MISVIFGLFSYISGIFKLFTVIQTWIFLFKYSKTKEEGKYSIFYKSANIIKVSLSFLYYINTMMTFQLCVTHWRGVSFGSVSSGLNWPIICCLCVDTVSKSNIIKISARVTVFFSSIITVQNLNTVICQWQIYMRICAVARNAQRACAICTDFSASFIWTVEQTLHLTADHSVWPLSREKT